MVSLELAYLDPRLVALYDLENARGADTDFYVQLATELHAQRIIDLGCGTGLLTRELARAHREVLGVDPAPAMLAVARQSAGAEKVRWIEGDASCIGQQDADLVLMTGNVAQVFLDDTEWAATLQALHSALRPGGRVAFESRNPAARGWEHWTREATDQSYDSPFGPIHCWLELLQVESGRVYFAGHNIFLRTGEEVVATSTLRFRTQEELTRSLTEAGFVVEHLYGGWHHEPVDRTSPLLVFVAQRH